YIRIHTARKSLSKSDPVKAEETRELTPWDTPERNHAGGASFGETGKEHTNAVRDPQQAALPKWQEYRDDVLSQGEKDYLRHLLAVSGENIQKACQISGLSRSRLYELLKKHRLIHHG
ncbi:MAG: hypothetical protein N2Z74_09005, partial [Syntrophales bacterium]|nr:hypothetical protein [Syntrophales bacterium]